MAHGHTDDDNDADCLTVANSQPHAKRDADCLTVTNGQPHAERNLHLDAVAHRHADSDSDSDCLTVANGQPHVCLLYTSDAADERSSVDLGGRRIIKTNKKQT